MLEGAIRRRPKLLRIHLQADDVRVAMMDAVLEEEVRREQRPVSSGIDLRERMGSLRPGLVLAETDELPHVPPRLIADHVAWHAVQHHAAIFPDDRVPVVACKFREPR